MSRFWITLYQQKVMASAKMPQGNWPSTLHGKTWKLIRVNFHICFIILHCMMITKKQIVKTSRILNSTQDLYWIEGCLCEILCSYVHWLHCICCVLYFTNLLVFRFCNLLVKIMFLIIDVTTKCTSIYYIIKIIAIILQLTFLPSSKLWLCPAY